MTALLNKYLRPLWRVLLLLFYWRKIAAETALPEALPPELPKLDEPPTEPELPPVACACARARADRADFFAAALCVTASQVG